MTLVLAVLLFLSVLLNGALIATLSAWLIASPAGPQPSDAGDTDMPILEGFQPIVDELNKAAEAVAAAKAAAAVLPTQQDVADTLAAVSTAAQAVATAASA